MKTVDVVSWIVFKDKKFLVEKRSSKEEIDPNLVCLPSGHVEPHETKLKALKREMGEELGIKLNKAKFIKKDFWLASNGEKQNVYYYLILKYEGVPACKTENQIFWMENVNDIDAVIDRKVIEKIRDKSKFLKSY